MWLVRQFLVVYIRSYRVPGADAAAGRVDGAGRAGRARRLQHDPGEVVPPLQRPQLDRPDAQLLRARRFRGWSVV